jgi:two-component system phosphate regulon response regulator PhoB
MNILIIEDDPFLAKRIGKVFESRIVSNRIRIVHSFLDFVREMPVVGSYDIILTDLKLQPGRGDLSGYRIIRSIREKKLAVPIVVISGFSEIERLREAFDYGANDYIIKPVRLRDLELRVLNWYKNYALASVSSAGCRHCYGGLEYDLDRNEFFLNGRTIPLTKNNKYVLSLFFTHPDKLLDEPYLTERIWGDRNVTERRNLRVNILRLKQSLSPFGIDRWIRNVRGEGYIFSRP